jgi:hypothetical protein
MNLRDWGPEDERYAVGPRCRAAQRAWRPVAAERGGAGGEAAIDMIDFRIGRKASPDTPHHAFRSKAPVSPAGAYPIAPRTRDLTNQCRPLNLSEFNSAGMNHGWTSRYFG